MEQDLPAPAAPPSPEQQQQAQKQQDQHLGGKRGHDVLRVRVMIDPPPPPAAARPLAAAETATATAEASAAARPQQQQQNQQPKPKPGHTVVNLTAEAFSSRALAAAAAATAPPLVRVAGRPPLNAAVTAAAAAAAPVAAPPPPPSSLRAAAATALALLIFPLGVVTVALYVSLALLLAVLTTACVWPSVLIAARFYETLPFARDAFGPLGPIRRHVRGGGAVVSFAIRCAFESAHATAVLGRLLTVPLRRELPTLYIAGLAKCGTTTLAAYLRREKGVVFPPGAVSAPVAREGEESALLSLSGLAEAASKETHFYTGVLGRGGGGGRLGPGPSALLYRSFFPIFAGARWWTFGFWRAAVVGRLVGAAAADSPPPPIVVDATPTYAALPLVARRIRFLTPKARVVVIVRDPVDALASAEGMMRSLGALGPRGQGWGPLSEAFVSAGDDAAGGGDARFADLEDSARLWKGLEDLPVGAAIPHGLCRRMCCLDGGGLGGAVEAAKAGARVAHLARVLGAASVMVVSFADLVEAPERVVNDVLAFAAAGGGNAGGRSADAPFRPLGRRMTGVVAVEGGAEAAGGGKQQQQQQQQQRHEAVHPSVRARLEAEAFAEDRRLLGELTGVDPAVLLRRPGKAGGGGGGGGRGIVISLSASAV